MERRNFLKNTAWLGAGLAFHPSFGMGAPVRKSFGLQLYTLRDVIDKDPKGLLKQVASFGYTYLENFETEKGMFLGMKGSEFKTYISDLGMTMISCHCNWENDFARRVSDAAEAGLKYLVCSYLGPHPEIDFYKQAADKFNRCGEECKKAGLRFAYHNHDYPFKAVQGQLPQDVLMQNTDKSLVDFEMDIYWVVAAGQDPIQWLTKYPDRFRLCHVKDRKGDESVNLGTGTIDFPSILKTGKEKGLQYFIVEQEAYTGTTPIAAVQADAEYMKKIKW